MDKKRFVVACGGTGGHVFPGLAVANVLKARGHEVCVWLSGRDIESSTLGGWDGPVFSTGAKQLSLRSLPLLIHAIFACRREMKGFMPDAMLAMGNYSSLPPVLAARAYRVPVVLHEANAVPGKAIDYLARFSVCVDISFPSTAKWLPNVKTCFTGLPVRNGLAGQKPYDEVPEGVFTVFVTGGSQGARSVNALTSQAFALLKQDQPKPFFVIHQCGRLDEGNLRDFYHANGIDAKVSAFLPDMGRAFASADLVICRAGASTCFELCLLGKPALLIPLPSAVRNHQHLNAEAMVKAGGADECIQSEMTPRSLMRYISQKMSNPFRLKEMGLAIKSCAVPDAAEKVADSLESAAVKK